MREGGGGGVLSSLILLIHSSPPPLSPLSSPVYLSRYAKRILDIGIKVKIVTQSTQEGLGHALLAARELIGGEPFLLMLGHHLYRSTRRDQLSCSAQLLAYYAHHGMPAIALQRTSSDDVARYGCVTGVWDDKPISAGTKASANGNSSGVFVDDSGTDANAGAEVCFRFDAIMTDLFTLSTSKCYYFHFRNFVGDAAPLDGCSGSARRRRRVDGGRRLRVATQGGGGPQNTRFLRRRAASPALPAGACVCRLKLLLLPTTKVSGFVLVLFVSDLSLSLSLVSPPSIF